MPSINYTKDGGVIIWDQRDFLAGSAPQYKLSSNKKFGKGAMFMRESDPFRNLGYLSPGFNPVDVTGITAVTSIIKDAVVRNPYAYMVSGVSGTPGFLHRFDLTTDTFSSTGTWDGTNNRLNAGANAIGYDVCYVRVGQWNGSSNANKEVILTTFDFGSGTNSAVTTGALTTISFQDANPDTITRSSGSFITDGFVAGASITVTGAANGGNNSSFIISSLTATVITLTAAAALTAEAAGSSVTIVSLNVGVMAAFNITDDNGSGSGWNNNFSLSLVAGAYTTLFKTGAPLVMHKSPFTGCVYITGAQTSQTVNDNWVACYDPRTGNYGTINATSGSSTSAPGFQLPDGFIATSFSETESYLIIYAYDGGIGAATSGTTQYRGDAKAFFWDRSSVKASFVYDLKDNYVNGGFNDGNKVGCFTWGRSKGSDGKISCIRIFNGSEFVIPENGIFGDSTSTDIPRHGGVEVVDDIIHWFSNGRIFSYGQPWPGLPPILVWRTTCGGTGSAALNGFIKNLSGTKLYASSGISTGKGLQTFDLSATNSFNSNSVWQALLAEPVFPQNMYGQIDWMRINFGQSSTGGLSTTLTLITDRGANGVVTILSGVTDITVQTTTESVTSKRIRTETNQKSDGSSIKAVKFSTIGPAIAYGTGSGVTAAPIYSSIEVYYKNIPLPT